MPGPRSKARSPRRGSPARARHGGGAWRLPARAILPLGIILLLFLFHSLTYSGLIDDAFISFRYARNLVEGEGLVFNPGVRVEGYTNFLWVMIMAGVLQLGGDPALWSRVLGIASGAGILILAYEAIRRARPDRPLLALAGPLFLASNRTFCLWSTGGLETAFFSLLCLAGIALSDGNDRRSMLLAGTALGLASMTRPEGLLVFACLAAVLLAEMLTRNSAGEAADDRAGSGAAARLLFTALPALLLVGGHTAFRLAYYGSPLPNSFAVKVVGLYPASGIIHLALFIRDYLIGPETIAALIVAAGLAGSAAVAGAGGEPAGSLLHRWNGERRSLRASLIAVCAYLAYITMVGGDHFEYRFFHPVLTLLVLPVAAGVIRAADLTATAVTPRAGARAGAAFALLLALKGLTVSWAGFQPVERQVDLGFQQGRVSIVNAVREQGYCARWAKAGQWLARNADPDEVLVAGAVGAIPYYSRMRTIDILGLNEPGGGSFPVAERGAVGHERRAPDAYMFENGGTYYTGALPWLDLPGSPPGRFARLRFPDGYRWNFQVMTPDAKIQPGTYTLED